MRFLKNEEFCHAEVFACNDDIPIPDYKTPIETRLVKHLRNWQGNNRSAEQEVCSLLEWYICECIPYGPNSLGGWWSDGVIYLEIEQTEPDNFKLLGVTWIDCHGLAPFEIDVELNPADDSHFARTVFRIGMLDDHRRPKILDRHMHARRVVEMRPRVNRDWAMAVELTPPRAT